MTDPEYVTPDPDGSLKRHPVRRKVRKDSKYKMEYTDLLNSGIRYKQGLSIAEICSKWRISIPLYYAWVDRYLDFKEAHERGKTDFAAWMFENFKQIMTGKKKGNAQCAIQAMVNTEFIEWNSKASVANDEPTIGTININILPAPQVKQLEQLKENIIEAEVVDNVYMLNNDKKI